VCREVRQRHDVLRSEPVHERDLRYGQQVWLCHGWWNVHQWQCEHGVPERSVLDERHVHAERWLQCKRRLLGEHAGVLGERVCAVHCKRRQLLHGDDAFLQCGQQHVHGVHGELQLRGRVCVPERVAVLLGRRLLQWELQRR
jgi:hypothetical protein